MRADGEAQLAAALRWLLGSIKTPGVAASMIGKLVWIASGQGWLIVSKVLSIAIIDQVMMFVLSSYLYPKLVLTRYSHRACPETRAT
jgi:hypothetical protein